MKIRLIIQDRRGEMKSLGHVDLAIEPRPGERIEITVLDAIEAYTVTDRPKVFQITGGVGSMTHVATCIEVVRAKK